MNSLRVMSVDQPDRQLKTLVDAVQVDGGEQN